MNDPFSLAGKNILVTGASSGIGKHIAITIAAMGATVHITGRDTKRLNETLNTLDGRGHTIFAADLTSNDELTALAKNSAELDGLVLSAGIINILPFKFISEPELTKIFDINFAAPILLFNKL